MQSIFFVIAVSSIIVNIGTLFEIYVITPKRVEEASKIIMQDFEKMIPDEKFLYLKTNCPKCNCDWTKTRRVR